MTLTGEEPSGDKAGPPPSSVVAVRYGTLATTRSHEFHRYEVYDEPDAPLQMDYFFWLVDYDGEKLLVDSGYHPGAIANRPGRQCLVPPVEALDQLGVAADEIAAVVVTHFHFDHIGNLAAFPNARYVVQQRELDFWTGPHGRQRSAAASVENAEVAFVREMVEAGRVDLIDGDHTLRPGIDLILVGGHCPGQQVVYFHGAQPLVLCSDALHFTEEMERFMPFNVFFDLEATYQTYDRFRGWQAEGALVVPGHDPRVMMDFPSAEGASGLAVQLR